MKKNIYPKLIFYLLVIIMAVVLTYPLKKKIKLGLDLQGGVHLVLEVDKDYLPEGTELGEAVDRALEIIRNRVDEFGVSEPIIQKQGKEKILVQLPGIKDIERAINLIGKTALLKFKLVNEDNLEEAIGGKAFEGYELLYQENENKRKAPLLLKVEPELTGANLVEAQVKFDPNMFNRPYIAIELDEEGANKFAEITGTNLNKRLAIVLDDKIKSAPVIKSKISDGKAVIEGDFTLEEARDLAMVLRAGSLPAPIKIIEKRVVGPTLGEDSIKKGISAVLIGLVIIIIFMLAYYKLSGLVASLTLLVNLVIIFALISLFKATLTLPGIAGIALTIGMAVDANIIIYERIKEELRLNRTIRASIDTGYQRAFSAIFDSNLTTLIIGFVLFVFGRGPIKGFGVTLSIGIITTMFTAVYMSKVIFDFINFKYRLNKLSI
ncbi:protein translocase subunit SecD [bacterium]|nr:protein translocase subunit SecD [bacterium]MBU1153276.1 protein translocase subunit SecD [bacterium]